MSKKRTLRGIWLGRRAYEPVHTLQRTLVEKRQAGEVGDTVLFVEHEPVITLGRGAHTQNLLVSSEALAERGVERIETGRGGDVTLHAPGQLVCYPILDLAPDRCDVRRYVGDLTETMRRVAQSWEIESGPIDDMIGLWVDRDAPGRWEGPKSASNVVKLGAIGVRISRWVTMHGFALNLTTDLNLFGLIVPCGISEYGVTSVEALTGTKPDTRETAEQSLTILAEVLGATASEFVSDEQTVQQLAATRATS